MSILSRIGCKSLACTALLIFILLSACSDKIDSEINVLKALDEGMTTSNAILNRSTEIVMRSLADKLLDPVTSRQAKVWHPKALLIQQFSKETCNYIEKLKDDLARDAGIKTKNGTEHHNEKDRDLLKRIFISKGKDEELYNHLKEYKESLFSIDSQLYYTFNEYMPATLAFKNTSENFSAFFFGNTSPVSALTLLTLMQNNVKITENRMVQFCDNKCGDVCGLLWSISSVIIAQDKSIVQSGENIEITAGVGSFSKSGLPRITFSGKQAPINADGTSVFKFKASAKPGKYSLPVSITYIDESGKTRVVEKQVEYTVAEKCDPATITQDNN
jgi:hypothetical protein